MIARIKSILLFCQFLCDGSLLALDGTDYELIDAEYERLLDFPEKPHPETLKQIRSVLNAYSLAFAQGFFTRDKKLEMEVRELLSFLATLEIREIRTMRRNSFIPKNLGSIFIRKGLGLPLFGYLRPRFIPASEGIVLSYQSIEATGIAEIQAVWLDQRTQLEYRNLGVAVESTASWLHARIAPRDSDRSIVLHSPFSKNEPEYFAFERYELFVERGRSRIKGPAILLDPLAYQYIYFFFADDRLKRNLQVYLTDILTAMYGASSASAREVALNFTQKLLRR